MSVITVDLKSLEHPATLVMGHRNPDTDAICAAIGYADLLRQTRMPAAEAACCGPPNPRTEWVLQRAGVAPPRLVMDVRPRAADICRTEVDVAAPSDTIFDAYHRMMQTSHRSMPVVDHWRGIVGMLSLQDLLELLIPTTQEGNAVRSVRTTIANVARALEAEALHVPGDPALEEDLLMMVAASSESIVLDRIGTYSPDQLVLITGNRPGVQRRAVEEGIHCLVVTGGFRPEDDVVFQARERNVAVLVTQRDTASTTQLIRGSRPISGAVSSDFVRFAPDTPLQEIREVVEGGTQTLFPVEERSGEGLLGVFSRSDLVSPPRVRLVLVDHNEFSQAVTGADEAEIVEVIDHHRLSGNLVTRDPIQFINKTVGSTCTIVGRAFRSQGLDPSPAVATCLCGGIISDTLKLTSPTTTKDDEEILQWLSEIAGLDVDRFTDEFFAAGSLLKTASPARRLRVTARNTKRADFASAFRRWKKSA